MPTCETTARKSFGALRERGAHQEPAVRAALDREPLGLRVASSSTSRRAHARKSSNTFCFFVSLPASCHSSPNSPPPRRFAVATTTPRVEQERARGCRSPASARCRSRRSRQERRGSAPSRFAPFGCRMNIGTRVPSFESALSLDDLDVREIRDRLSSDGGRRRRPSPRGRRRARSTARGSSTRRRGPRRRRAARASTAAETGGAGISSRGLPSRSQARTRLLPPERLDHVEARAPAARSTRGRPGAARGRPGPRRARGRPRGCAGPGRGARPSGDRPDRAVRPEAGVDDAVGERGDPFQPAGALDEEGEVAAVAVLDEREDAAARRRSRARTISAMRGRSLPKA